MGLITFVMLAARAEVQAAKVVQVTADAGDGDSSTVSQVCGGPAYDFLPLPGDALARSGKPGAEHGVGFTDTALEPLAALPGEVADGSRSAAGVRAAWWYAKADGGFLIANLLGSIELMPDGSVNINGAVISAAGEVTNAAGKVLGTHTHSGATLTTTATIGTGPAGAILGNTDVPS